MRVIENRKVQCLHQKECNCKQLAVNIVTLFCVWNFRVYSLFVSLCQCSHRTRIAAFARYGHVTEVITYLGATLEAPGSELSSANRRQLSDLLLYCFLHQFVCSQEKQTHAKLRLVIRCCCKFEAVFVPSDSSRDCHNLRWNLLLVVSFSGRVLVFLQGISFGEHLL